MKLTVLKYVQKTLNEMDSDAVNGIADTTESLQVAELLQDIYIDLMSVRNWPHLKELLQIDGLADTLKPNYMKLPVDVKEMTSLSYNIRKAIDTRDRMVPIKKVSNEQFLADVNNRKSDADNIQVVDDFSGIKLNIFDDREPTFWTSFDEEHIVFDAFNSAVDTTMQKSKSQAVVYNLPSLALTDGAIPDMPSEMVPLLLNELKSRAGLSIGQKAIPHADKASVRQRRAMSRRSNKTGGGVNFANFARRVKGQRNAKFDKN